MFFSLSQLGLLDAPPEDEYDNLTSLAAELLGVPMAHVSIADHSKKRIFYKSQFGHPDDLAEGRELPMESTFCQHVALTQAPVVVGDSRIHPLVKGTPAQKDGPLAYLGLPVSVPGGEVVGGLCLMQPEAREWTDADIITAKKLASCVTDLIKLRTSLLTSEQLRREQKQFTYSLSHDLQSPANTLNLILNEIEQEIKATGIDDGEATLLVNQGLDTLSRMKKQVEDVLNYSQTIDLEEVREPIALNPLIDEIVRDLRGDAESSNATINCTELPDIVGNKMQLRALFQNLISNAIKFSPPDISPVVNISSTHHPETGQHWISVADNGIGIAPENQGGIFDLFKRLHVREQYEGSGVGLALCHRVVENHYGSISVVSDGQNGTEFVIKLSDKSS